MKSISHYGEANSREIRKRDEENEDGGGWTRGHYGALERWSRKKMRAGEGWMMIWAITE